MACKGSGVRISYPPPKLFVRLRARVEFVLCDGHDDVLQRGDCAVRSRVADVFHRIDGDQRVQNVEPRVQRRNPDDLAAGVDQAAAVLDDTGEDIHDGGRYPRVHGGHAAYPDVVVEQLLIAPARIRPPPPQHIPHAAEPEIFSDELYLRNAARKWRGQQITPPGGGG